ncbi:MAG TPA: helix-turn-helix transcriptional regulator, partial [Candidatus Binatia bacterium]|nr:helix-turn-helix transcriptional regulator [Candidatus Binatia bacterium]
IRATPLGRLHLVGVSLRPESCAEFLPLPTGLLTAAWVEAADIFPDAERVRERLGDAASFAEQRDILLSWLAGLRRPHVRTAALHRARERLRSSPAAPDFDAIARELCVSGRQARRIFEDRVGLGPAAYGRLLRFTNALRLMHAEPRLTTVAHRAGYFDQPHFCREFRQYAGMTPQEYRRFSSRMPDVLFSPR